MGTIDDNGYYLSDDADIEELNATEPAVGSGKTSSEQAHDHGIFNKQDVEREAIERAFKRIMGDITMPDGSGPHYEKWLFNKVWEAATYWSNLALKRWREHAQRFEQLHYDMCRVQIEQRNLQNARITELEATIAAFNTRTPSPVYAQDGGGKSLDDYKFNEGGYIELRPIANDKRGKPCPHVVTSTEGTS